MKNILFILINKILIDFIVKIMLKRKFKTKIIFFFNNSTFKLIYDMKITLSNQLSTLKLFYINHF